MNNKQNTHTMKKNTLKITVIALVAAVCAPMFLTSCSKDTNTRVATFTITNDRWELRDDNNYYCDFAWSALDNDALTVGNVNAYLILTSSGTEYQEPLPYVYLRDWTFTQIDTLDVVAPYDSIQSYDYSVYQPVNVRYDVSPGRITFMLCDLGDLLTVPNEMLTMRFRAVVTYPVEY